MDSVVVGIVGNVYNWLSYETELSICGTHLLLQVAIPI